MQKWYLSVALACGCSVTLVGAASAQVDDNEKLQREIEAIRAKIQIIQAQQNAAGQVQILPAQNPVQVQADVAVARVMPGPGIGIGNQGGMAQADAAFVGRVVAFEPMDVEAAQFQGGPNVKFRVAIVQVTDPIFGLKKGTEQVRVAFIPQMGGPFPGGGPGGGVFPPNGGFVPPNGGLVPPDAGDVQILPAIQPAVQPIGPGGKRPPFMPGGNFQIQLQMGQDGMFAVNKHHKETFFLSPNFQNFLDRQNPSFDNQVKTAKALGKVIGDPIAALKSDDKTDRYTAAAVLINKYRSNTTGQPMKLEPISAEESKLILRALAGADWAQKGGFGNTIPGPFELFYQLGITVKDGYNPVNLRTQQEIQQAMQKWLNDNQDKFIINKLVVDPNAKTPIFQPGGPGKVFPGGGKKVLPGGPAIMPLPAPPAIEIELPRDLPLPVPVPPAPVPVPLPRD